MSPNFSEASALRPRGAGRFEATIDPSWLQGKGAFGGLAIGLAVRAMLQTAERPLRSLTAELPGPLVPGSAEIAVELTREGRGLTSRSAVVRQGPDLRLRVSGLFGTARAEEMDMPAPRPPDLPDHTDVPVVQSEQLPPPFTRHFEYRPTGPMPFAGSSEARAEGYVAFRVPPPVIAAPELIALMDAYWPSIMATQRAFRPMATIAFMLHLTQRAHALDPSRPLVYRARTEVISGGYLYELRELWTEDGELVGLNPQTFSIAPARPA